MNTRWKPNVTVAAIMEHGGSYLLVEEETPDGLRLNNPAGHLERGESIVQAVQREALEETAHAFTATALLGVYLTRQPSASSGGELTYLRFALRGLVGALQPGLKLDSGIVRALWMTPAQIESTRSHHRSPLVWQCVQDHLRGQSFALDLLYTHPSVAVDAARP